jgi:hypothetical protein
VRNRERAERPSEALADRDLIERIGQAYEPDGLTPSMRRRLDRDLWARIEKPRHAGWFRPVLTMVTVVATVLWFARPPSDSDTATMAAAVVDAWEYDILYSDSVDDRSFDWGGAVGLPDDVEDLEMLIGGDEPGEGKGA